MHIVQSILVYLNLFYISMKKTVLASSPDVFIKRLTGIKHTALPALSIAACMALGSCDNSNKQQQQASADSTSIATGLKADAGNGDIQLPNEFGAVVVADTIGRARHLVIRENGDIYVALREVKDGGGIVALRDTDKDGKADQIERFGEYPGTGIGIHNGYLYFAPDSAVFRYKLNGN